MCNIEIKLLPFEKILKVYFVDDYEEVYREYKDIELRNHTSSDFDGFYFRNVDSNGNMYDVIAILNDGEWKKAGWIQKSGLIIHEVSHCIDALMDYLGTKNDEIRAEYMQYVFTEIVSKYDFKKNKIMDVEDGAEK